MKAILSLGLIITSFALVAMEENISYLQHPSLPSEFYEGIYGKLLEDPEQKEAIVAFACARLQSLLQAWKDEKPILDRGDLEAAAFGLYDTKSTKQCGAVQAVGRMISTISMRAFRKALGVTMGMGDVSEHETWELKKVSPTEFSALFKAAYPTKKDFLKVELVEQIHAYKKVLELAQAK